MHVIYNTLITFVPSSSSLPPPQIHPNLPFYSSQPHALFPFFNPLSPFCAPHLVMGVKQSAGVWWIYQEHTTLKRLSGPQKPTTANCNSGGLEILVPFPLPCWNVDWLDLAQVLGRQPQLHECRGPVMSRGNPLFLVLLNLDFYNIPTLSSKMVPQSEE